jgi:AraC-like DNA-binding protein
LGFSEVTHFNNFFKKHVEVSPLKFRNVWVLNFKTGTEKIYNFT